MKFKKITQILNAQKDSKAPEPDDSQRVTTNYEPKDFHEALQACLPYFERGDRDAWLYVANHNDLWHSACLMSKWFKDKDKQFNQSIKIHA